MNSIEYEQVILRFIFENERTYLANICLLVSGDSERLVSVLTNLETAGLITRHVEQDFFTRTYYIITKKGEEWLNTTFS